MRFKIPLFLSLGFLILMASLSQPASASTSQWYPSENSTCEYDVTWKIWFAGNWSLQCDYFNVYNMTATSVKLLVPAFLDRYFPYTGYGPVQLMENYTKVTTIRNYLEYNSTHWERTVLFKTNNFEFTNGTKLWISLSHKQGSGHWAMVYKTAATYIREQNFALLGNEYFYDYFNASKEVGEKIDSSYTIIEKTDSKITAFWSINEGYNRTYVADINGKVQEYFINGNSTYMDGLYTSQEFILKTSLPVNESIPGYSFLITLPALIVMFAILQRKYRRNQLFRLSK